ncbi:glycosyltransferase [Streptomyces sp. 150FB]|uniref:glycosyltransferase n=1 Tax=Streptomyces sp. 150FB TaxID=1576605 RepID=UPI000A919A7E|nr:glycosyltransferase [Streptomyces sp. 150FB]
MKALVYVTDGSRGDIQPYLALAHALNRAGHTAVLAGPRLYQSFAAEYEVAFAPLNDELVQLQSSPDIRGLYLHNDDPEARRRLREAMTALFPKVFPLLLRGMWEAASDGADVVVYSPSSRQVAPQIAERLGVPHVLASLYPHHVTSREYSAGPGLRPTETNLEDHARVNRPLPPPLSDWVSTWRSDVLGLQPRDGSTDFRTDADGNPTPVLHSFSPHVLKPASDWPEWVHTTGFWTLSRRPDWQPPAELVRFLANGRKPISIGFGSMFGGDPEATGALVAEAVRKAGERAVVVEGWGGVKIRGAEDILVVKDVPYDWLFPQVRAAVHAGGVGTFNAALVAGVPQVACPFHNEQQMWADHVHGLGVATAPLKFRELTAEALAAAVVTATTDERIGLTAQQFAEKLGAENGVEEAVRVLERVHTSSGRVSSAVGECPRKSSESMND